MIHFSLVISLKGLKQLSWNGGEIILKPKERGRKIYSSQSLERFSSLFFSREHEFLCYLFYLFLTCLK
jgi:hypothetical protein